MTTDQHRQPVPLAEQAEAANRTLAMVHRSCEGRVKRGDLSRADADREISVARAIRDTLRLFADHEDAVRHALRNELSRARFAAEAEALREDDAVAAVLDALPGATITDVRDISPAPTTEPAP